MELRHGDLARWPPPAGRPRRRQQRGHRPGGELPLEAAGSPPQLGGPADLRLDAAGSLPRIQRLQRPLRMDGLIRREDERHSLRTCTYEIRQRLPYETGRSTHSRRIVTASHCAPPQSTRRTTRAEDGESTMTTFAPVLRTTAPASLGRHANATCHDVRSDARFHQRQRRRGRVGRGARRDSPRVREARACTRGRRPTARSRKWPPPRTEPSSVSTPTATRTSTPARRGSCSPRPPVGLVRASVGNASNVWGLDETGTAWRTAIGQSSVTSSRRSLALLSAASDGSLWGIDTSGHPVQFTPDDAQTWTAAQPLGEAPVSIAAGAAGDVWVVGKSGTVYQPNSIDRPWVTRQPPSSSTPLASIFGRRRPDLVGASISSAQPGSSTPLPTRGRQLRIRPRRRSSSRCRSAAARNLGAERPRRRPVTPARPADVAAKAAACSSRRSPPPAAPTCGASMHSSASTARVVPA